jgi:hypothetical protein
MLQTGLTQQIVPQIQNPLYNLNKSNTQKIKTNEDKNDDPKYDFLFSIMQGYSLKLSEINSLNCKRLSEFDQNTIAAIKKIDEKVHNSHKLILDIKKDNDQVKTIINEKMEDLLRECVLGTKDVHLRVQNLKLVFDSINQEFDFYSGIVRSFEEQVARIKNDTRQVYHIPSKTLTTMIQVIQKKISSLQICVEDLATAANIQGEVDAKEELDNINNFVIIAEELFFGLQTIVYRANSIISTVRSLKIRLFGQSKDTYHHNNGFNIEADTRGSIFQEPIYSRLESMIEKLN